MRRKGYPLTWFADDWVITCKSVAEARTALAAAIQILERNLEILATDVTEVRAITPCQGFSNRVEFTAHKHRRVIGDMLLHDETEELAKQLRHAISLRE